MQQRVSARSILADHTHIAIAIQLRCGICCCPATVFSCLWHLLLLLLLKQVSGRKGP
jgi:hypothetical protein